MRSPKASQLVPPGEEVDEGDEEDDDDCPTILIVEIDFCDIFDVSIFRLIDIDFEPFILLLAAAGAGAAFFLNQAKKYPTWFSLGYFKLSNLF